MSHRAIADVRKGVVRATGSFAKKSLRSCLVAVTMVALSMPLPAAALPRDGQVLPAALLVDADGRRFDTSVAKGKPFLIVYEDKDSSGDNALLKDELAQLARTGSYASMVTLAAIADVSAYDFWPARGFVKDAIRKESKKAGTTIYCDWDGSARERLSLSKGKSNVVLVSREGKVIYAAQGKMGDNARLRLFSLLKAEVAALQASPGLPSPSGP